ncbi:ArpU family phage packaging/lysis transcriptional regulator [Gordoniibacillus kamchatkensis]|uniref:ArpU family phage packaging/lysis transcriptional regulator n=1 Tax=Gordoniibacillus kamchatkensis TaxID=1590651 RepID=UPI00069760D4|nr:ArpU family phage packaging/lysis transcriptional regulator [Paenibacillus sp. VKM B-2647]
MTASYELRDYKPSNIVSSPVEDIAIKNIDEINRRQKHIERAYKAINRLGTKQQKLIRMRYMEDDYIADSEVAAELGYSDRHYRRLKSFAIYRLANMLGLLVLKEE